MLGDRIKELRIAANEKQSDLAAELSVSKQSISNWENNNILPPVDIVCRIARHYGCSTDYLLEMDDRTFFIETTYLTQSQTQNLKRLIEEMEQANISAGLFERKKQ